MHLPIAASELNFIAVSKPRTVFKYGRDWHELRAVAIGDDEQQVIRLFLTADPHVKVGQSIVLEQVAASTGTLLVGTVRAQDGTVLVQASESDLAYGNGSGNGHDDLGERGLDDFVMAGAAADDDDDEKSF
ncbi:MAG: hypothetical protein ABR987_24480 [Terracidiphilus sp.]